MIPPSWKKGGNLLLIAGILAILIVSGYITVLFDRNTQQSERHDFHYSLDLSYTATLENVTILLPVPRTGTAGTPFLTESLVEKNLYGVPAGWNVSVDEVNGTPMLAIRAGRMVPEYHGYPIAIEPGQSPLPATRAPGTEYSADTPVLQPVHLGIMIPVNRTIDTGSPVGNEPLFAPDASFDPREGTTGPYAGKEYAYTVPVYVGYESSRPAAVSLSASIGGTNSIWKGGWVSNSYADRLSLELEDAPGWTTAAGVLRTEEGVPLRR